MCADTFDAAVLDLEYCNTTQFIIRLGSQTTPVSTEKSDAVGPWIKIALVGLDPTTFGL